MYSSKGFILAKHAVLYLNYFVPEYVIAEDRVTRADGPVLSVPRTISKLAPAAYPIIFPNLSKYLSVQVPKKRKEPEERQAEFDIRDEKIL